MITFEITDDLRAEVELLLDNYIEGNKLLTRGISVLRTDEAADNVKFDSQKYLHLRSIECIPKSIQVTCLPVFSIVLGSRTLIVEERGCREYNWKIYFMYKGYKFFEILSDAAYIEYINLYPEVNFIPKEKGDEE